LAIDLTIVDKIPSMLQDRGFENIKESIYVRPTVKWPSKRRKRLGSYIIIAILVRNLPAFALKTFRDMSGHEERTQCLLAKARTEISSNEIRVLNACSDCLGLRSRTSIRYLLSIDCHI